FQELLPAVRSNLKDAGARKHLFGSGDSCPLRACTIHCVGGLRRSVRAIASRSALVAYHFPDLGNSHGTAALALSFDAPRELAGAKGGRRTVSGKLSASLHGQARLSGCFCNRVDRGWGDRLHIQPRTLWKASLETGKDGLTG